MVYIGGTHVCGGADAIAGGKHQNKDKIIYIYILYYIYVYIYIYV